MPSYHFICKKHKALVEITRISLRPWSRLTQEERNLLATCPQRDGLGKEIHQMDRSPNPPSAQKKETLDNGAMRNKLERFVNAEELYKDRAAKSRQ